MQRMRTSQRFNIWWSRGVKTPKSGIENPLVCVASRNSSPEITKAVDESAMHTEFLRFLRRCVAKKPAACIAAQLVGISC